MQRLEAMTESCAGALRCAVIHVIHHHRATWMTLAHHTVHALSAMRNPTRTSTYTCDTPLEPPSTPKGDPQAPHGVRVRVRVSGAHLGIQAARACTRRARATPLPSPPQQRNINA